MRPTVLLQADETGQLYAMLAYNNPDNAANLQWGFNTSRHEGEFEVEKRAQAPEQMRRRDGGVIDSLAVV